MNRPNIEQSVVIDPKQASDPVKQVEQLIRFGGLESAWERVRHLHPADVSATYCRCCREMPGAPSSRSCRPIQRCGCWAV